MKKALIITAIISSVTSSLFTVALINGHKTEITGIIGGVGNGQEFLRILSDSDHKAYVQGFINGVSVYPFLNISKGYGILAPCLQAWDYDYMVTTIVDYINKNPNGLSDSLNVQTYNALNQACRAK